MRRMFRGRLGRYHDVGARLRVSTSLDHDISVAHTHLDSSLHQSCVDNIDTGNYSDESLDGDVKPRRAKRKRKGDEETDPDWTPSNIGQSNRRCHDATSLPGSQSDATSVDPSLDSDTSVDTEVSSSPYGERLAWKARYDVLRLKFLAVQAENRSLGSRYKNLCTVIRRVCGLPDDSPLTAQMVFCHLKDLHVNMQRKSNKVGDMSTEDAEYYAGENITLSGVSANKFSASTNSNKEVRAGTVRRTLTSQCSLAGVLLVESVDSGLQGTVHVCSSICCSVLFVTSLRVRLRPGSHCVLLLLMYLPSASRQGPPWWRWLSSRREGCSSRVSRPAGLLPSRRVYGRPEEDDIRWRVRRYQAPG